MVKKILDGHKSDGKVVTKTGRSYTVALVTDSNNEAEKLNVIWNAYIGKLLGIWMALRNGKQAQFNAVTSAMTDILQQLYYFGEEYKIQLK